MRRDGRFLDPRLQRARVNGRDGGLRRPQPLPPSYFSASDAIAPRTFLDESRDVVGVKATPGVLGASGRQQRKLFNRWGNRPTSCRRRRAPRSVPVVAAPA